ncbi:MAG: LysR family transcriptional regulator [Rhodospirillales bacterium]|nr:LysR family transcriptional regulator [Rhodospirillales bacterium]MCB9965392.1 LysR family transcriptional regulator [Rhodospirillales bacterium]MCB9973287.1 LysR family transcriptional regulator [Rhodospirillales bacterium]MCB9980609.1 LysR family transcriptional regulator [Rhodospirillales bacterium]
MELAWIDDFLTLEHVRNFTAAARTRHTTQPAFSRRIANMEQWLGSPLFLRETRPVKLTKAGEEFLPRARRIREEIMDARRIIKSSASQLTNALRIYTTNTIAIGLLPQWLRENHPQNYTLVVSSVSACKSAFQDGKCDLAIFPVFSEAEQQSLPASRVITTDRMILTVHIQLKKRIIHMDGMLSGPLMIYTPGTAYAPFLAQNLARIPLTLTGQPVCESASAEALLAQVKAGIGAAWIPESLLRADRTTLHTYKDLGFPYRIIALENQTAQAASTRKLSSQSREI